MYADRSGPTGQTERVYTNMFNTDLYPPEADIRSIRFTQLQFGKIEEQTSTSTWKQYRAGPASNVSISFEAIVDAHNDVTHWWGDTLAGFDVPKEIVVNGLDHTASPVLTYSFRECLPTAYLSFPLELNDPTGGPSTDGVWQRISVTCSLISINSNRSDFDQWIGDMLRETAQKREVSVMFPQRDGAAGPVIEYHQSFITSYSFPQFNALDDSEFVYIEVTWPVQPESITH